MQGSPGDVNTGFAFAINNKGKKVAHKDTNLVKNKDNDIGNAKRDKSLEDIARIEERMVKGESAVDVAKYEGENSILSHREYRLVFSSSTTRIRSI